MTKTLGRGQPDSEGFPISNDPRRLSAMVIRLFECKQLSLLTKPTCSVLRSQMQEAWGAFAVVILSACGKRFGTAETIS